MFPTQIPIINPDEYSRCNEREQSSDHGKDLNPIRKTDAAIKESVYHAIWKDSVLRAIEYDEIDVQVHTGIVHLNGHSLSSTSQIRVMNAIRTIPGILGIQSHLVFDDQLTLEVATSLGNLEHTYDCKFFTGASHGVISMDGIVRDETVKLLAERQVSSNPKVRGVINHVRVDGSEPGSQGPPFLQPVIGETIYFLDGISGNVKQVVINPDNRRVIAMIIQGKFTDQRHETNSMTDAIARLPEQQVVVPMSVVRYLTKVSGFLYINSHEKNRFMDFDPGSFISPNKDWVPPHPYCPEDVSFPADSQTEYGSQPIPFTMLAADVSHKEHLIANDSLGG